jgi:hypothetical protein
MIDGQFRYEVAVNMLDGHPVVRDPALHWGTLPGRHGSRYSYYNASGSVAGFPLVWLGRVTKHSDETQRFLFSMTSAVAGGLLASAMYLFYRSLDVERRAALAWTAVSAFGTLLWPLSASTFDQAQHALFVLLAIQLGRASARLASMWLAVAAGITVAALLNYQETYLLLVPALALSTIQWKPGSGLIQGSFGRCCGFLSGAVIGILAWLMYNAARFGNPVFFFDKLSNDSHPPLFGNPAVGLLSLAFSPGKSILLYSPPLLLGFLGVRRLWRRDPPLGLTLVVVSAIHLLFVSSLRFFGSDWAWGPRYLVVLLPLWALAFPFVDTATLRRGMVGTVVALGIMVQVLALTVDHQRFFFERALPDHFWAEDRWFYFRESALLARPGEIAVSLRDGVPRTARWFAPHPYPDSLTYAIFGNPRREFAPVWMQQFQVFYLPRPWPLWMRAFPPDRRPVRLGPVVFGLLAAALLGASLVQWGVRGGGSPRAP